MSKTARPAPFSEIQRDVGLRMKWARELVQPNRAKFARLMGVDASTLTKIEEGERPPSIFVVREYANRLRATTDFFLRNIRDGLDRELELELVAAHPELLRSQPDTDTIRLDTGLAAGTIGLPKIQDGQVEHRAVRGRRPGVKSIGGKRPSE